MSIGGVIASTNCQDITELGGLPAACRPPPRLIWWKCWPGGLPSLGGFLALAQSIELLSVRSVPFMAVFLLTNALTALGLVRVFRHVFLGDSDQVPPGRRGELADGPADGGPHGDRAADAGVTGCLESLDGLLAFRSGLPLLWWAVVLWGWSLSLLPLSKAWSRSLNPALRWFQDLLAYDFYTEEFYRLTIVNVVAGISRLASWFDRGG